MSPECSAKRWPPLRLALVALLLAFSSSFSFGFQLLITNPAETAFLNFLHESKRTNISFTRNSEIENEWSFIVALFFLGAAIGSFLIRLVAERLGRKQGIIAFVVLQAVSSILTITSYWILNSKLFAFARLLMGVSIAVTMGVSAMFVTESSPTYCRGVTSLMNGVLLQLSVCVGAIMAMPKLFGCETCWWYLYLFQLICNVSVLCCLHIIHDSPGFLASRNRPNETRESVLFYHGVPDVSAQEIAEMLIETHHKPESRDTIFSVWRDPFTRRGTMLGMLVTFSMAMSGITVVNAFGYQILRNAGLDDNDAAIANVAVCFFSLAGIAVSTRLIDHLGRKPLLVFTFSSLIIVNFFVASLMYMHHHSKDRVFTFILIAFICSFNFLFAMGPGPVSIFLTGELVLQSSRSASSVWTNFLMAIMRFLTLSAYTPLQNYTSDSVAYASLFILPMVVTIFVLLYALPETKGRNAEDLFREYEIKAFIQRDTAE